jgi:transcriptional regulator with XRE-family HTH domain
VSNSKGTELETPRNQARKATDVDVRIGQLIRERRLELSMTQDELAKSLRIAQTQLQKYEAGGNRISASRLVDLARVLQVAITWFYQWTDPHTANSTTAVRHADEATLIETFRDLTPAGRAQLVSIAEVLRGKTSKPSRRSKRT